MNPLQKLLHRSAEEPRITEMRAIGLFQKLSVAELRVMDELLHERCYEKGEVIFDEGDPGLGLFIVLTGRVKVVSSHAAAPLALEYCCGDFFGELSLFEEVPRTAKVVAVEPARVNALFRTELRDLLERDRNIAAKVLYELAGSVSRRSRKLLLGEQHLPSV
jgi:CRP/FNR family cyclic AMP-dependent transcriptional regulator